MGRAICVTCHRPDPVCVCPALPEQRIHLGTRVMVLQHPCECRKQIIGTVPLLALCLQNFELLVARGAMPARAVTHIFGVSTCAASCVRLNQAELLVVSTGDTQQTDYRGRRHGGRRGDKDASMSPASSASSTTSPSRLSTPSDADPTEDADGSISSKEHEVGTQRAARKQAPRRIHVVFCGIRQ
jgi:hypothetical protein